MKTTLTVAAASAALALATPVTAQGLQACADRAQVVEKLASSYGETRQGLGLGANNGLVEMFVSQDTGTWTITITRPGGQTCLIASGQSWEEAPQDLAAVLEKGA